MQLKDKMVQAGIDAYKKLSRHMVLPVFQVKVETTKICNLKCLGCRRNYKMGSIATEPGSKHLTVGDLWRICATTNMQIIRFEGDGEPTCNPHFKDLVSWCSNMGIRSAMTSNATLLDKNYVRFLEENGMRRIHVSFDGTTQDTFEALRVGADYDKVKYNCKLIGNSKIQLFMSCLLSNDNVVDELGDYPKMAKDLGASGVHVMKYQVEVLDQWQPPSLPKDLLANLRKDAKTKGLVYVGTVGDHPYFTGCEDPYICPYVLIDGSVYSCSYMANLRKSEVYGGKQFKVPYSNYCMGNLNNNWIRNIWKNEAYRELRQELKESRRLFSGKEMSSSVLLKGKNIMEDKTEVRFGYCHFCLCRWGESGM